MSCRVCEETAAVPGLACEKMVFVVKRQKSPQAIIQPLVELVADLGFSGGPLIWITNKVTHNYKINTSNSVESDYFNIYSVISKKYPLFIRELESKNRAV